MKTIHQSYSNIPCQGKDCIHCEGEYEDVHEYPQGYNRDTGLYNNEPFKVIWHGMRCSKSKELSRIRQEIYNRALIASDEVHKKGYKSIHTEVQKAGEAFDRIADEWRNMKCPFYETENYKKE